jgi:hypothetical protein
MRGVSKSVVRFLAVVALTSVVAVTAAQAETRHQENGGAVRRDESVVQHIKRIIIRAFGGDIAVPNPEPAPPPPNTTT